MSDDNPFEGIEDIPVSASEEQEMQWLHGVTMVMLKVYLDCCGKVSFMKDGECQEPMLAFMQGSAQAVINASIDMQPRISHSHWKQMQRAMRAEGKSVTERELGRVFPHLRRGNA